MCWATVKTKVNQKKYDKQQEAGLILNAFDMSKFANSKPEAWDWPHPGHSARMSEYDAELKDLASKKIWRYGDTAAFGDSLMDQQNKQFEIFTAVNRKLNFAIGGAWAQHIAAQGEDVAVMLHNYGLYDRINYIVSGCYGGNPFLQGQPLEITVQKSIESLDRMLAAYPDKRHIIYGIPPVNIIYATKQAYPFEDRIYKEWVLPNVFKGKEIVFLPLQRRFGGKFGIFPDSVMTSDGVHLSPKGCKRFSDLVDKGKEAKPGSIVDKV